MQVSKKEADLYLNIALQEDRFSEFIAGESTLALLSPDGYGDLVFSPSATIMAIYRKYDSVPEIVQTLEQEILRIIENETYLPKLINLTDLILAHLHEEENGRAPFSLDRKTICEGMEKRIRLIEKNHFPHEEGHLRILRSRYDSIKRGTVPCPD